MIRKDKERLAPYECDLHTHTNRSDGADTYEELIDRAVERGLKVLAITDHDVRPLEYLDTDQGKVSVQEYGRQKGIDIIPGIEFSCNTEVEDVHILGLGCDFSDPGFAEQEAAIVESKVESYSILCDRLTDLGMPVSLEKVQTHRGRNIKASEIQKKMIFEYMADMGYTSDWSQAKRMVKATPELQVKRRKPEAEDMIRLIKRSGGIAVMAHPYLVEEPVIWKGQEISRDAYIQVLMEAGLDGIEGPYTYHKTSYGGHMTPDEIENEIRNRYADQVAFISGGSDYHDDRAKGAAEEKCRELGEKGISYEDFRKTPLFDMVQK